MWVLLLSATAHDELGRGFRGSHKPDVGGTLGTRLFSHCPTAVTHPGTHEFQDVCELHTMPTPQAQPNHHLHQWFSKCIPGQQLHLWTGRHANSGPNPRPAKSEPPQLRPIVCVLTSLIMVATLAKVKSHHHPSPVSSSTHAHDSVSYGPECRQ